MEQYVMGIDVGTGTSKGVIIDEQCRIVRMEQISHAMDNPAPGFFEMDAEEIWWGDVCRLSRSLLAESGIAPEKIRAIGISALGCDCVPVDENGKALMKAILYGIDSRAQKEIAYLNEYYGDEAERVFGHEICTSDIAPKILWIKRNRPEIYEKTAKFLTASSFICAKLTGRYVIDRYLAEDFRPMYDLQNDCISQEGCGILCRPDQMADLADATEISGTITKEAAQVTGLCEGMAVLTGTGDSGAEAVGTGVFRPGDMMVQVGSTAYFVCLSDHLIFDGRVWPGTFIIPGVYSICAGTNTAGTLTQWLAKELFRDITDDEEGRRFSEMAGSISGIPAGSDGLMVLPYFAGERTPIGDPNARGLVIGLTLSHTREHLYKAALEGIAYSIDQHVKLIEEDGVKVNKIMMVGGGTKNSAWLQIIADVLGREIHTAGVTIGAAFGDALMASLAAGFYESWEMLSQVVKPAVTYRPDPAASAVYEKHKDLFVKLYIDNREHMHYLAR